MGALTPQRDDHGRTSNVHPFSELSIGCDAAPRREDDTGDPAEEAITGFASVQWGTPMAEILSKRGEPSEREGMGGGTISLLYPDTILQRPVSAIFDVHPEHGLIAGSYIVRIPDATSCELMYNQLFQAIRQRYPALPHQESESNDPGPDFCTPARSGTGGMMVAWRDTANGSTIQLLLAPPAQGIVVLYRSSTAYEVATQQREEQL